MRVATYFFICVDLSLALFEVPTLFPLPFLVSIKPRMSSQTWSYLGDLSLFPFSTNFNKYG